MVEPGPPVEAKDQNAEGARAAGEGLRHGVVGLGLPLLAAGLLLFLSLRVFSQGLDLGADGRWLLAADHFRHGRGFARGLADAAGPPRVALLAAFFSLFGENAHSLAVLKSVLLAISGGLGLWWFRARGARGWAWLLPVGLLFLGRVSEAAWAYLLVMLAVEHGLRGGRQRVAWLAAGVLILLTAALDLRWGAAAGVLAGAGVAAASDRREGVRRLRLLISVMAVLLFTAVGVGWITGDGGALWRSGWQLPAGQWAQHFAHGGAFQWWSSVRSGFWLGLPFAELNTGEHLSPLLAMHGRLRAWGFRALALALWSLPWLALWLARRRRWPRSLLALALGLGASGWLLLLSRGDLPGLRESWLVVLLLLGLILAHGFQHRRSRWLVLLLFGSGLLPLGGEQLWLILHAHRPSLQRWDHPRAGIELAPARIHRLEDLGELLGVPQPPPALIWPSGAGLHFLHDVPTLEGWISLADAERQPAAFLESLRGEPPESVLLAINWAFTSQQIRDRLPGFWSYLREHYRIAANAVGGSDPYRILRLLHDPQTELGALSLPERLPDLELGVFNDRSPALRPKFSVGQSFMVGDQDLSGVAIRWSTQAHDLHVRIRVRVWMKRGDRFDTLLAASSLDLRIPGDGHRSFLRLEPIEGTAHQRVAVTFELRGDTAEDLRLYWHRFDPSQPNADLYPAGAALLDLKPTDADLYFFAY